MKNLKISIIVASYNSADTIEQTLYSIINQSYANIELVVVDGGSTDNTLEIIKKYIRDGDVLISEPDRGIYDAFNKGVNACTGDYVEFIGSDDSLVSRTTIEEVVREIEHGVDILSCREYLVNDSLRMQKEMTNAYAINREHYSGGMIPHAGMFTRKTVLQKYPFDIDFPIAGDYKFFLQCYFDEKISIKFCELHVVFFSDGGISNNKDKETDDEKQRIHKQLGVDELIETRKKSNLRSKVKVLTQKLKIYGFLRKNFIIPFTYKKHKCSNGICRWCGRYPNR